MRKSGLGSAEVNERADIHPANGSAIQREPSPFSSFAANSVTSLQIWQTKFSRIFWFANCSLTSLRHAASPRAMKALAVWSMMIVSCVAAETHPADVWEWTLESGYLWECGHNTDLNYEIIPTQLTLRTPVAWRWWEGESGAKLVVRRRFSALVETFTVGPEDYYVGLAAAPSIEYWFPSEKTSLFFSIGGGAGWTNSSGGTGGQGQDFALNWFTQLGVRRTITTGCSLLGGIYFIHHSNLGMTDPNPGIDALGFTLGCSWRF